ncbi:MAG: hypothetical protein ACLSVX_02795 [Massilimicrobiota timonensis]
MDSIHNDKGILIAVGKKLEGLKITQVPKGQFRPSIFLLSPTMFLIALQTNWTSNEIKAFQNRISLDIAYINDVLDIVITIDGNITVDVAYNSGHKSNSIEFSHFEEGTGMAFHLVMIDNDLTVLNQRIVSLDTDKSNDFVDTLIELENKHFPMDVYNNKINQLYSMMSIQDIKRNAFIHQGAFVKKDFRQAQKKRHKKKK